MPGVPRASSLNHFWKSSAQEIMRPLKLNFPGPTLFHGMGTPLETRTDSLRYARTSRARGMRRGCAAKRSRSQAGGGYIVLPKGLRRPDSGHDRRIEPRRDGHQDGEDQPQDREVEAHAEDA